MRRLSLILSDLYVPEEATREKAYTDALELPHLAWLLRFAQGPAAADWRAWFANRTGCAALAALPVAHVAARELDPALARTAWFATPVRLEARLDHVRLSDRGLLRVANEEGARWCAEFARQFGPDVALHAAGDRGFLLTGIPATDITTTDPARLLDSDVAHALPRGGDAGALRRLGSELEMWLHATPLNTERERSGRARISAFWFWGGGTASNAALPDVSPPGDAYRVHGGDPYLAAVARAARVPHASEIPEQYSALDPGVDHVIELTPMSDPRGSLAQLEERWFAPARAALSAGTLGALDILANDRWFRIGSRPGWRIWRKRRGWLASLVHPAATSKA